jgi:hypothetical protein
MRTRTGSSWRRGSVAHTAAATHRAKTIKSITAMATVLSGSGNGAGQGTGVVTRNDVSSITKKCDRVYTRIEQFAVILA